MNRSKIGFAGSLRISHGKVQGPQGAGRPDSLGKNPEEVQDWIFSVQPLVKIVGLVAVVIVLFAAAPALAQSPPRDVTDDEVNAIAKELYCPVCESTPLDVCPTQACADWREVIRTKLSEGQTAEQIEEYFAIQYGARALAEPPREGFTLAIWIVPIEKSFSKSDAINRAQAKMSRTNMA